MRTVAPLVVALLGAAFAGCGGGGGSGGGVGAPPPATSPTTPTPPTTPTTPAAPTTPSSTTPVSSSTAATPTTARLVWALSTGHTTRGVSGFATAAEWGLHVASTLLAGADSDLHVARWEPAGTVRWSRRIGNPAAQETCEGVVGLNDGGCVLAGTRRGATTFGQGEPTQTTLPAPGGDTDGCLARFGAAGDLVWARQLAGSGHAVPAAVTSGSQAQTVDVAGNFFAPSFSGTATVTLGPGEANQTTFTTPANAQCAFVARLDAATGQLVWAREVRSSSNASALSICAAADGGVYVAGTFSRDVTFAAGLAGQTTLTAAGARDGFLARFLGDGTFAWAEQLRPPAGREALAIDAALLPGGDVVVAGGFGQQVTLRQGEADQRTLSATSGGDDALLARFTQAGGLVWARAIGGAGHDRALAVCAFLDGQVAVAGDFHGPTTFGPGEPDATTIQGTGNFDLFVARHRGDGSLAWATWVGNPDSNIQTATPITTRGLADLQDGSSALGGSFSGAIDLIFGPGEPGQTRLPGGFVARHR